MDRFRSALVLAWLPLLAGGSARAAAVPPYPPSPAIESITWHETIDLGTDNDNWPVTWADDGHVYAAGGDGNGFGGSRGNWICRIDGEPGGGLSGRNIARISTGSGSAGTKGSGLLSVDGTLYLWVRNANGSGAQSRLGVSTDHGDSWTWGFTFAEFGYTSFVNFGQDYAGARDGYVYVVSHDDPSAYTPTDHFVLMRVPKNAIGNRNAYEFYVRGDGAGGAVWSGDITQRGAVFTHGNGGEGRCARSGISYNAALGRYLWWQQYPGNGGNVDTRFSGGFGIYDAPEPWGPWTTAYFTTNWDMGPGDGGSFCSKYTSADGKEMWLVFSGDDSFQLRRATITLRAGSPVETASWARAKNLYRR
jgi:hypothetical protein